MGVVYEAVHEGTERRVAIKVLDPRLVDAPEMDDFRREARASARIGSDYIIDILDLRELPDGRLFSVMELVEGSSLASELESAPMSLERLIPILRQACKGLAAAHEAGIVHRDIKPDNIMVTRRDGRPDAVKLLDFGIAVFTTESHRVRQGGTPHYMAPEQILSDDVDERVDVYALAATAYDLLTGTPPHDAPDVQDLLRAKLEEPVEPPSELVGPESCPPALDRVLLQALATRPEDRIPDMLHLEAALCEAQIEMGIETAWDDLPVPEVEAELRDRILHHLPTSPELRDAKSRRWLWPAVAALSVTIAAGSVAWSFSRPQADEVAGETPEEGVIARLVREAEGAAARASWVYPTADNGDAATAYRKVLELETGTEPAPEARAEAGRLRDRYAAALVGLGDRYWDEPAARAFAVDFYLQALVFRDHPTARERVAVTPGELATLRERAAVGEFSSAELLAARILEVLATTEDPDEQAERLAALEPDDDLPRPSVSEERLRRLTRSRGGSKPRRPSGPDEGTDLEGESEGESETGEANDPESEASGRTYDRAGAARLAAKGRKALDQRDRKEAERLFHQSLDADPTNVDALDGLGDIYFDRGKYSTSLKYRRKAVRYAPKRGPLRIELGDAYFKTHRYADALAQYEKAKTLGDKAAAGRIDKVRGMLD